MAPLIAVASPWERRRPWVRGKPWPRRRPWPRCKQGHRHVTASPQALQAKDTHHQSVRGNSKPGDQAARTPCVSPRPTVERAEGCRCETISKGCETRAVQPSTPQANRLRMPAMPAVLTRSWVRPCHTIEHLRRCCLDAHRPLQCRHAQTQNSLKHTPWTCSRRRATQDKCAPHHSPPERAPNTDCCIPTTTGSMFGLLSAPRPRNSNQAGKI